MRRILCFLAAFVLIFSMIPVQSRAADPYAFPVTYTLTGNQRKDIIGVALTQVGYVEGYNNDTKYGDWYGLPHQPWCAMFVTWCARQAGVPASVLQSSAIAAPRYFGYGSSYFSGSTRRPQSGDIFFTSSFSHVGLVKSVEGSTFTTVEGNTNQDGHWDGSTVRVRTRYLSACYFISPNYVSCDNHNPVYGYDAEHPHREYQSCANCGETSYTGGKKVLPDCVTCIRENCTHSYDAWEAHGTYHRKLCSICGKEETEDHKYDAGVVTKEATCGTVGYMDQTCTVCNQTRTLTLPPSDNHEFGDWEKRDENDHVRICIHCHFEVTDAHNLESNYSTDIADHWKQCTICEEKIQVHRHEFGSVCGDPCRICGYRPPEGHIYGLYQSNGQVHWRQCVNCNVRDTSESHIFEGNCDSTCDVCGLERAIEHTYSEDLISDGNGHWRECTQCGLATEILPHVAGAEATEESAQVCVDCGWEIHGILPHEHKYEHYEHDGDTHWATCTCGFYLEPKIHHWDMDTGFCKPCGLNPVAAIEDKNWDVVWAGIFGAPILVLLIVFIVWRVKRSARDWRR